MTGAADSDADAVGAADNAGRIAASCVSISATDAEVTGVIGGSVVEEDDASADADASGAVDFESSFARITTTTMMTVTAITSIPKRPSAPDIE